jgi:hypothetical protein
MVFLAVTVGTLEARGKRRAVIEPEPIASPTPTPKPSQTSTPRPEPTTKARIGFRCTSSCSKQEREKVERAEVLVNEIVASKCFKDFMLSWGLLDENGKRVNAEKVVSHIRSTTLEVPVVYYYQNNGVVGYRQPPSITVHFNRKFHNYYNDCDTASNALHEWSHALEYGHPFNPTSWRGRTVPYALNNAVEECCDTSNGYRGTFEVR